MPDSDDTPVNIALIPEGAQDGVDVTLIRWMLSLTAAERLQFLQERIQDVQVIRELNAGR